MATLNVLQWRVPEKWECFPNLQVQLSHPDMGRLSKMESGELSKTVRRDRIGIDFFDSNTNVDTDVVGARNQSGEALSFSIFNFSLFIEWFKLRR